MSEKNGGGWRRRKRFWLSLMVLCVLFLGVLLLPPLVNISRYKAQITNLIAASLGRPVRLSSVEARLFPWPGFVLTDLSVAEDPAYGAEPVLHADTVRASIRLLSLWRGRLEIDTIRMDDASLNLVRIQGGGWNLDPLLRTATAHAHAAESGGGTGAPRVLPFFEASNSRINIKNGVEKLPFSLVNADISFWQPNPGEWRVRLRGEPVRTDISLAQADTGFVRLDADLHEAPALRQMPVHLDMEWSQAQLGQLTLLLLGSDAGWRGDLTGDLHLSGTAEAAQIKARLRATGVRRAEFVPAEPMDFDANCGLIADLPQRAVHHLTCDSPLGDGQVHLSGEFPGGAALPHFSVDLDRIPVAAALDALRTLRSGLAPDLEASGTASGNLTYAPAILPPAAKPAPSRSKRIHSGRLLAATAVHPLTGSIAVKEFELRGDGLSEPIRVSKLLLAPALGPMPASSDAWALAATTAIPAGAAVPLTVSTRFGISGYRLELHGQASIARVRELASLAGLASAAGLKDLTGDAPLAMDMTAEGPWLPVEKLSFGVSSPALQPGPALPQQAGQDGDRLSGTLLLRDALWKAGYLADPVRISEATLRAEAGQLLWSPVIFSYGPVEGTASLTVPFSCSSSPSCAPAFQARLGALNAAVLQTTLLGAHERGTLLSTLLARFRLSSAPAWPDLDGSIQAASLELGPVTLEEPTATVHTGADGARITALDAGLLGGHIHVTGTVAAASAEDKPSYALEGQFEKISPQALGRLLGLRCSGGALYGNGRVELAGFTARNLAASARGSVHFDWRRGSVAALSGASSVPRALARFDHWSADLAIANGQLAIEQSQLWRGARTLPVHASISLSSPPRVVFARSMRSPARR
ncbi:MAG: AsmA family protein [Terracidiphilus sp.]